MEVDQITIEAIEDQVQQHLNEVYTLADLLDDPFQKGQVMGFALYDLTYRTLDTANRQDKSSIQETMESAAEGFHDRMMRMEMPERALSCWSVVEASKHMLGFTQRNLLEQVNHHVASAVAELGLPPEVMMGPRPQNDLSPEDKRKILDKLRNQSDDDDA